MIELGLVMVLLGGLVGGAALIAHAPWDFLLGGGAMLAILGLLVGVPAGIWYHLRLFHAVRAHGEMPAMWWLRPHVLHDRLSVHERVRVMRPFYLGAIGFVCAVAGCVFVAYGAWRSPPG